MFALPLLLGLLAGPIAARAGEPTPEVPRVYQVQQTTRLNQVPTDAQSVRWWISIPGDERSQDLLDLEVVSAPGPWRIEREARQGNRFLYVEVDDPKAQELEVVVSFRLRREPVDIEVDPARVGPLTATHRSLFAEELRHDAPHMQVTPQIQESARFVCGRETNLATRAKLLLQYVADEADHYSKDPTKPKCGVGDADACMEQGGGCCTDLNSLFIALARASGIPARMQMGYRLLEENEGKEVDPGYRCWVEYFLPGYGWVPADIVEADAQGGLGPERWFNGLTERRLWLNQGREFQLSPPQAGGPVNTMAMGYAEIDEKPARVLPEGELLPQLTRVVRFTEERAAATAQEAQ